MPHSHKTPINLNHLSAYDYPLPEALIAKYPLPQRDHSRMLVMQRDTNTWQHSHFHTLPKWLQPNDLLVINNTKVLPARLKGHREGFEGQVEIFLLHPSEKQHATGAIWHCLMRPAKKLRPETRIVFPNTESTIEIVDNTGDGYGEVLIQLVSEPNIEAFMQTIGEMPIPPYLNRPAEESDKTQYQTVFSKVPGAQAAPTAGLHFSETTFTQLNEQGVRVAEITLAVGAGTFKPVQSDDITEHQMDPEHYSLPPETIEALHATKKLGGRVIAVGTTVMKTLETVASEQGGFPKHSVSGWSELFIKPGFRFQVVEGLLTNFHLPKSTLLMLVSAFTGRENILAAYTEAIQHQYRFYSYGDCMLLLPPAG